MVTGPLPDVDRPRHGDAASAPVVTGGALPDAGLLVLSALADETRWAVLQALSEGDLSATALADRLPVTRQAVAKHLAVLEGAGLVESYAAGRERRYRALGAELTALGRRLESIGQAWDARLTRLAAIAEDLERGAG